MRASVIRVCGIVLALAVWAAPGIGAQEASSPVVPEDVAIQGYSPVSYFEKNLAERGRPEFSAGYQGKTYWFASAEQVEVFNRDPKHYVPLFSEFCPYSLTLGRKVAIDPTRFKILDGQLLLFHNSVELDALKEWNKKGDDAGQLRKARSELVLFRF